MELELCALCFVHCGVWFVTCGVRAANLERITSDESLAHTATVTAAVVRCKGSRRGVTAAALALHPSRCITFVRV